MNRYCFNLTLSANVSIDADTREKAEQWVRERLDGAVLLTQSRPAFTVDVAIEGEIDLIEKLPL